MDDNEKTISIPLIIGGFILVIIIGAGGIVLALNKKTSNSSSTTTALDTVSGSSQTTTAETSTSSTIYKDGTYQANGSYNSPAGTDTISVNLTIKDETITAVTVSALSNDSESRQYINRFAKGISAVVVGKTIDNAYVYGRVNGASLTGDGFNNALKKILQQAATN